MKEKTNSFRGKITKEAQRTDKKGGSSYLKLPEGIKLFKTDEEKRKVKLDILPYVVTDSNHPCKDLENGIAVKGQLWYRRPIKVHRVGQNNERVICPRSVGKPCPICEYQKKRYDENAPKEETKTYYPQSRSLYAVIPVDDGDDIFVLDMADKMFQEPLFKELQDCPENEIFPDLEEGKTVEVKFKWNAPISGKGKPYPEAVDFTFHARDPYKESILDEVPCLDDILVVKSYNEIKAMFFELDEEPDGGKLDEKKEQDAPAPERRERRERKVEKPEQPEEPRRRRESEEPAKSTGECPHEHKFGVDFEKFEICDKCAKWDDCYAESKRLKKLQAC